MKKTTLEDCLQELATRHNAEGRYDYYLDCADPEDRTSNVIDRSNFRKIINVTIPSLDCQIAEIDYKPCLIHYKNSIYRFEKDI